MVDRRSFRVLLFGGFGLRRSNGAANPARPETRRMDDVTLVLSQIGAVLPPAFV